MKLTQKIKQLLFMKKSILTTIVLSLVGYASFAFAPVDTNKVSHNVKVIASPVLDIQMTSTDDVEMTFATSTDYDNGVESTSAAELKVKATKAWQVTVSTTATNFDAVDNANDTELAAADLKVRKNGTNAYKAITSGDAIATGNKGGHTGNRVFSIDYKLDPGYFAEDTYTVPVTFTVSNQ